MVHHFLWVHIIYLYQNFHLNKFHMNYHLCKFYTNDNIINNQNLIHHHSNLLYMHNHLIFIIFQQLQHILYNYSNLCYIPNIQEHIFHIIFFLYLIIHLYKYNQGSFLWYHQNINLQYISQLFQYILHIYDDMKNKHFHYHNIQVSIHIYQFINLYFLMYYIFQLYKQQLKYNVSKDISKVNIINYFNYHHKNHLHIHNYH